MSSAASSDSFRAVCQPRWPLFLGRKTCVPTRPVFEALTDEYSTLEEALRHCPWSWLGSGKQPRETNPTKLPKTLDAYLEVADGERGPRISSRQDAVRINAARLYGFCSIQRLTIDFPNANATATSVSEPNRSL